MVFSRSYEVRTNQVIEPDSIDLIPKKMLLYDILGLFARILTLLEDHAAEEVQSGVDLVQLRVD